MKIKLRELKKRLPFSYKVFKNLRSYYRFLSIKYQQMGSKRKWKSLLKSTEIKLNLGSGQSNGINGWINVDQNKSDINWDLKKGIPLPNSCVAKIYTSHFLEHISYKDLLIFVSECHRVLIDGGKFKVVAPNARLYIDAYINKSDFRSRDSLENNFHNVDTGSSIDQVNFIAYLGGEHKYMFDEENLINICLLSGFSDASLTEFDINQDSKDRDFESLYVTAIK